MKLYGLILIILVWSCGRQNPERNGAETRPNIEENPLSKYILHPADSDTLCIKSLNKAKDDVKKGRIVYCVPMFINMLNISDGSWSGDTLRCEKYLKQLCNKYKIDFDYERQALQCVISIGVYTQGCYQAYMDKIIAEKFGSEFKKKLFDQADSLLAASNDTMELSHCDTHPHIPGRGEYETEFIFSIPEKLRKKLKTGVGGHSSAIEIIFYIDKEGNASGYYPGYFADHDIKSNQKYKEELFNIGLKEVKAIKHWEPGIVRGQKVITRHRVTVSY